jgi:hypothetical protein
VAGTAVSAPAASHALTAESAAGDGTTITAARATTAAPEPRRAGERTARGRALRFRRKVRRIPRWGKSHLRGIAWCESRNNPRALGGGGAYRGLYQFSFGTWYAVGGRGDPVAAPRSEQTWRAWRLLKNHGSGHWPVCG